MTADPLTILTPLHSFEPGGVERVALRLNAIWQAQGIDAIVIMGRDTGDRVSLPQVHYRSLSHGRATAWCETLWMILRLPGVIRQARPDVLFCAGNTYAIVVVAMRLILGKACPPIIAKVSNDLDRTDLGPLPRWFYRRWLRIQGRFIDRFVGMAEPMRQEIAKNMAVCSAAIAIVPDPALSVRECQALEHPRLPANSARSQRFVAAGRLSPQKNFALLLRAFALGSDASQTLTIIGEGPERELLERLARSLGIADRVSLPGHRPWVAADFANADAFLLSSNYEGVPAVVIEALASGLPVVATDCSVSMDFLLGNGRFGRLVPRGDVAAFAAALATLDTRDFRPEAARAHVSLFTVEHAVGAYLTTFRQAGRARRRIAKNSSDDLRPAPSGDV